VIDDLGILEGNYMDKKLRDATILFLIKKGGGEITDLCLAMKKRSFGVNRWNGVGGKVEPEKETVEEAAIRETQEEINVLAKSLEKVAELTFYYASNPDWDQLVHVYVVENWDGEPSESEEMKPAWFKVKVIPYDDMWPDDLYWLPEVLKGYFVKATFKFGKDDLIASHTLDITKRTN